MGLNTESDITPFQVRLLIAKRLMLRSALHGEEICSSNINKFSLTATPLVQRVDIDLQASLLLLSLLDVKFIFYKCDIVESKKKPTADWRAPVISNFMRNGQKPSNRVFIEENLLSPSAQHFSKRSKSLNPLIYPEWWGGYEESKPTLEALECQNYYQAPLSNRRRQPHEENSLDRRLMEAKEAAARLERMFAEKN